MRKRLSALLLLAGAAMMTPLTVGSATAATGGGLTCKSLTATVDSSAAVTGTISGCNSVGHDPGTLSIVLPFTGSEPGSIYWPSRDATSLLRVSLVAVDFPGACPRTDPYVASMTLAVVVGAGPFEGTTGGGVLCVDFGGSPLASVTNLGPFTL